MHLDIKYFGHIGTGTSSEEEDASAHDRFRKSARAAAEEESSEEEVWHKSKYIHPSLPHTPSLMLTGLNG